MHTMFSIVAISVEEFKRLFTSVEGAAHSQVISNAFSSPHAILDTASVLVWVDAQLQQVTASAHVSGRPI
jgi:hypothetical protein